MDAGVAWARAERTKPPTGASNRKDSRASGSMGAEWRWGGKPSKAKKFKRWNGMFIYGKGLEGEADGSQTYMATSS